MKKRWNLGNIPNEDRGRDHEADGNALLELSKPSGSLENFLKYVDYDSAGRVRADKILSKECFDEWVKGRLTKPERPGVSFRRALIGHVRGFDRRPRKPFPPEVEAHLLVLLRRKIIWPCFEGTNIRIGERGFRIRGYHESRRLEKEKESTDTKRTICCENYAVYSILQNILELVQFSTHSRTPAGVFANVVINYYDPPVFFSILNAHFIHKVDFYGPKLYDSLNKNKRTDEMFTKEFLVPRFGSFDTAVEMEHIVLDLRGVCLAHTRSIFHENLVNTHWLSMQSSKLQEALRMIFILKRLSSGEEVWFRFIPKPSLTDANFKILLCRMNKGATCYNIAFQDVSVRYVHLFNKGVLQD
mmetsp:Transcript_12306/g.14307  ORF Transcript_12306/g.14307 Transcript_12306/m.14307 type:complete len:358 (-) Transcript_12306:1291-2364(-)